MDRSIGRLYNRSQTPKFHGHVLWLQPNPYGRGKSGENRIYHQSWPFLLQSHVIQLEKCWSKSTASKQDVP